MLSSMVRKLIWLSVWTSIWTVGSAAPLDNENKPKGLKLDIKILHGNTLEDASPFNTPGLVKRSRDSVLELTNMATYYLTDIYVGSNREKCTVQVDTSSSDSWVMGSNVRCNRQYYFDYDEYDGYDDEKDDEDDEESEDFYGSRLDSRSFKNISDFGNDSRGKRSMSKRNPDSKTSKTFPKSTSRNTKTTSNAMIYKNPNPCLAFGSFKSLGSSTFNRMTKVSEFFFFNPKDEYSMGFWGSDTIGFANTEFKMIFGVAKSTIAIQGMLGIGPVSGEMLEEKSGEQYLYENFPQRLKSSGIINKNLYSVFLNQKGAQNGSILFGAVDHKKYSGHLRTVPVVSLNRDRKTITHSAIVLNRIYLENKHQKVTILNQNIGIVLQSASNFQRLPEKVVRALAHSLQAQYSRKEKLFRVDCGYKHDVGKIVYKFSGIKIRIPLGDLIIENKGSCFLGVESLDSENYYVFGFLGTSFLRNVYMVNDLEDLEISLAQAHYTDEEDVEVVTKSVPRAIKAKRYSSTTLATAMTHLPTEIFKLSPKNSGSRGNVVTTSIHGRLKPWNT